MKKGIFIIFIGVFIIMILTFVYLFHYDNEYTNSDFNITSYKSNIDMDNDGVDDQSDILASTRKYISNKPRYKSKYYKGGYPNDNYGVCTDVVGFALLDAGYDLRKLVNEDIINNQSDYNVDPIDIDIDFRRVTNLKVYFNNHAISLTTDIKKIDEWQGGDIVIFKKHIGIISDKRNKKGIPFIIHHANPFQLSYEEDILERRNDIVGHYRIS
ncbi:MAG: DUF1287 domain-containing protein [Bacilli bacterium]|nr:DUF1287 domain-containing protein [Bacilli bacterium]